jgi:hypothetical protein
MSANFRKHFLLDRRTAAVERGATVAGASTSKQRRGGVHAGRADTRATRYRASAAACMASSAPSTCCTGP